MQSNLLVILLVALCMVSAATGMTIVPKQGNGLQFSHEIVELFSGLLEVTLEGEIDSDNLDSNQLGAFIKVAGQTFPILESMGITKKSLQFTEEKCWNLGWVYGCAGFNFEFYIGWFVSNGTARDYEYLNVTYVPYVKGEGNLFANVETWPLKFETDFSSRFVNINIPISTQLNFKNNIEYCYDAGALIADPSLLFTFETTVKSCTADMADNIFHPGQFDYACSYGSPILVPIIDRTDVPVQFYNLLKRTCFTLYQP